MAEESAEVALSRAFTARLKDAESTWEDTYKAFTKWKFLDPWWAKVADGGLATFSFIKDGLDDVAPQYQGMRVRVVCFETAQRRQAWEERLEALELVTLMAIVDPKAWKKRVLSTYADRYNGDLSPRLILEIDPCAPRVPFYGRANPPPKVVNWVCHLVKSLFSPQRLPSSKQPTPRFSR